MEEKIKIEEVKTGKVPLGAEIKNESCTYTIRKISNGFILKKVQMIDYIYKNDYRYANIETETYVKESPIDMKKEGGKFLAEAFE